MKRRDLSQSIIHKQFTSSAIVMTMVELSHSLTAIIDGLMTSRILGATEMAAYGLVAPYFIIATAISGMLMVSCQNKCTRCMGNGRMDEANRVFSLTCAVALILSGAATLLTLAFSGPISALLGARGNSAELLPYTRQYLIGVLVGMPANVLIPILVPIIQLDGDSVRANLIALTVGIGDVAGNILFVVVFKLGLLGFGLGTSLSYVLGVAMALTHFTKKDRMFRFALKREDWKQTPELLHAGLPRAVSKVCRAMGPVLLNAIVLAAGATTGLTIMSIQTNVRFAIFSPATGIGSAVLLMAGIFAGEQDLRGLKSMSAIALRQLCAVSISIAVLTFAGAPLIAGFYLPGDAAIREIAARALRLYALSIPIKSLNTVISNHLEAVGTKRIAYFFNICLELVYPVICAFVMSRLFGLMGVFLSTAVADLLLFLTYVALALRRRDSGYAGADRLLYLTGGFGIPEEDSVSLTVTSMNEVIGLSQQVQEFCKSRGADERRAFLSALCIEEMAGNTVQYGFADGKPHTIDIRALIRGDDVVLRLRDDCGRFDLKEKVAHWTLNPEHPEENIGIRLILGMAKDVSYANTMRTNYLLITV